MAIEVNAQSHGHVEDLKAYPIIKICHGTHRIVLFTAEKTGFELSAKTSPWHTGYYSNCWAEAEFVYFDGTVTLQNKRNT